MFKIESSQNGKRRVFIGQNRVFIYYNPIKTIKYLASRIEQISKDVAMIMSANSAMGGGRQ